MGVTKYVIKEGGGQKPYKGATVTIDYTGWLYDESKDDKKGTQFDSSVNRGEFKTEIGTGKVIKGWDEGILGEKQPDSGYAGGMTLGEKATLVISHDYAYGDRGFPGVIPPKSTLIFDVELKKIN